MRYLRYLFLLAVGFCLLIVALANRGSVPLQVIPDEMAAYVGQPFSLNLPLFVIIFGAIGVGLLIGFIWEWFREHKHRVDARTQKREKEQLARQVRGLKKQKAEGKDDVLALLEDAS